MSTIKMAVNTKFAKHALKFQIVAECNITKARASLLSLPHATINTPVFMPVGTQGTLKGITPEQIEAQKCFLILGNTYHLGMRPGTEVLDAAGGLHNFMNWRNALLTDSGGFQMVSLIKLSSLNEEGVRFTSPYDQRDILLTPEKSMEIQNSIGADIMMQLDDVVSSTISGPRVVEAMHRSYRWLDRCIAAHKNVDRQNLFPIVQGGLDEELRKQCVAELLKRDVAGYAIGGLSGGESKDDFWRMVHVSTNLLPKDKPRYLMGVGFAVDLVVCSALGCDMFDCVFPTRTARFGCALVWGGQLNLKNAAFADDFRPIDDECECVTCRRYTRAYLNRIVRVETVACHLISIHNVNFQMRLMSKIGESIKAGTFVEFVKSFMNDTYPEKNFPQWVIDALAAVNIQLDAS